MKSKHLFFVLPLLWLQPLFAQTFGKQGQFELSPYGGYSLPHTYGILEPQNSFLAGLRAGYWFSDHFELELSAQRIFSSETTGVIGISMDAARLNALWNFAPQSNIRPFLTLGGGYEHFDSELTGSKFRPGYNAGLGVRGFFSKYYGIRLEGRYVLTNADFLVDTGYQHNIEAHFGLFFLFGKNNTKAKWEEVPAPVCPAAPVCPEATACEPCAPPPPVDGDSDGDGVVDSKDKCGNTPENTVVDGSGCPETVMKKTRGVLKGVTFVFNSADLTEPSKKILQDLAITLKEVTDGKIEVQGHTDNIGDPEVNLKLSEVRATTVVGYLVDQGIDEARLTAKGYGSSEPRGSNKTKEGRAKNRRVELKWLD